MKKETHHIRRALVVASMSICIFAFDPSEHFRFCKHFHIFFFAELKYENDVDTDSFNKKRHTCNLAWIYFDPPHFYVQNFEFFKKSLPPLVLSNFRRNFVVMMLCDLGEEVKMPVAASC